MGCEVTALASEAVKGAALALEGADDVHGRDGFQAGVLGVGDGVADATARHFDEKLGSDEVMRVGE